MWFSELYQLLSILILAIIDIIPLYYPFIFLASTLVNSEMSLKYILSHMCTASKIVQSRLNIRHIGILNQNNTKQKGRKRQEKMPGVRHCAVRNCKSSSKNKTKEIKFFKFPMSPLLVGCTKFSYVDIDLIPDNS